jgi:hypothetical protein
LVVPTWRADYATDCPIFKQIDLMGFPPFPDGRRLRFLGWPGNRWLVPVLRWIVAVNGARGRVVPTCAGL